MGRFCGSEKTFRGGWAEGRVTGLIIWGRIKFSGAAFKGRGGAFGGKPVLIGARSISL